MVFVQCRIFLHSEKCSHFQEKIYPERNFSLVVSEIYQGQDIEVFTWTWRIWLYPVMCQNYVCQLFLYFFWGLVVISPFQFWWRALVKAPCFSQDPWERNLKWAFICLLLSLSVCHTQVLKQVAFLIAFINKVVLDMCISHPSLISFPFILAVFRASISSTRWEKLSVEGASVSVECISLHSSFHLAVLAARWSAYCLPDGISAWIIFLRRVNLLLILSHFNK